VANDATEGEIKTAYRKAALKFHPDKQASKSDAEKATAEASFKAVGEAYEVLSNPEQKERYDQGVEVEDLENPHAGCGGGGGHHRHGGHGGMDPNVLFQMFMQQQMGGRR
jgi:DnaJ-class molecular chaperone